MKKGFHGVRTFEKQGSPQLMIDADQVVVWRVDRKPFGEVDTRVASINMGAGFPRQYAGGDSGYTYHYFRYYDPTLGRYIQSDPIGLAGGVNTFGYVSGNPIAYIDPFGLQGQMTRHRDREAFSPNYGRSANRMGAAGSVITLIGVFPSPATPFLVTLGGVMTTGSSVDSFSRTHDFGELVTDVGPSLIPGAAFSRLSKYDSVLATGLGTTDEGLDLLKMRVGAAVETPFNAVDSIDDTVSENGYQCLAN